MKCQDFREIIDSYLSDELLTETNHGILSHMEECANCRYEIAARREIRGRLKAAVINDPAYLIDSGFVLKLEATLKRKHDLRSGNRPVLWLQDNSWIAAAASLLIALTLGFVILNQFGEKGPEAAQNKGPEVTQEAQYTISDLRPNHIINIALGDHEHCAIRHYVGEAPISLSKASENYRDLDKIVVPSLKRVLSGYELTEAHECKYKNTKFAHIVFSNRGKTLSVLVTDLKNSDDRKIHEILNRSSLQYQIAHFNTDKQAIFVVSNLSKANNNKVTQALYVPLRKHFGSDRQFQAAFLTPAVLSGF